MLDMPFEDTIPKNLLHDLINTTHKIKKDIEVDLENTLKFGEYHKERNNILFSD